MEHFDSSVQIGLTATPLKNDIVQTDDYFGEPIYTYSLRTGINDGFLAPYRVRYVLMGATQEQEPRLEIHEAQGAQPTPISSGIASPTSIEEESFDAEAGMLGQEIIEETAATLIARTAIIARHLAAYMRQADPLAKTIVFCADQPHAEEMRAALERACLEYVKRYPGYIERIVSDEGVEGKRALGHFSAPEERTPVIVTTSRLLSTGVDVPTCKNIVLARPVRSMVEFKQIIGRGSRLHEPDKTWFTIIDYAGAIKLFFDASFDGDPELVEVEPLLPRPQQVNGGATNEPPPEQQAGTIRDLIATPAPAGVVPPSIEQANAGEDQPSITAEHGEVSIASEDTDAAASIQPPTTSAAPVKNTLKEIGVIYPTCQEQKLTANTSPVSQPVSSAENGSDTLEKSAVPALASQVKALDPPPPVAAGERTLPTSPPVLTPQPPELVKHTRSGQAIGVIGEYVYDLGPDGKTLRVRSSYRDFAASALHNLVGTPNDLRVRWLHREQREALQDALEEEGVDLPTLTEALHLSGVDPLDLLLHIAFGQPPLTRSERVKQMYREHATFFNRYRPEADTILRILLAKYEAGEAQDVSDPELLKVPPLSERGTFMELARPFGGGAHLRAALKELQELLYSA